MSDILFSPLPTPKKGVTLADPLQRIRKTLTKTVRQVTVDGKTRFVLVDEENNKER